MRSQVGRVGQCTQDTMQEKTSDLVIPYTSTHYETLYIPAFFYLSPWTSTNFFLSRSLSRARERALSLSQSLFRNLSLSFSVSSRALSLSLSLARARALSLSDPLRWYFGVPMRPTVVVYSDAQNSLLGCKGLGIVVHNKETGINHICGGKVPPDIIAWVIAHRGDLQSQINQCELLALVAAVLTIPDLLRDRHVFFWVDNITALGAAVHGYPMLVPTYGW